MQWLRRLFNITVTLACVLIATTWRRNRGDAIFETQWFDESPQIHETYLFDRNRFANASYGDSNALEEPLKFYILAPSEYCDELLTKFPEKASMYYSTHLNEESAEVWLHRGFEQMGTSQGHVADAKDADVILIAGYLHLNLAINKNHTKKGRARREAPNLETLLTTYKKEVRDLDSASRKKPFLMLCPTWNPSVATNIGIFSLVTLMESEGIINLWSVGFERNTLWQGVPVQRIIPIPYVVQPPRDPESLSRSTVTSRTKDFIFYAGDYRKNAKGWAGCHRDKMIPPLQQNLTNTSGTVAHPLNIDVRLVTKKDRMEQTEYNHRMVTSEYCLILCGDTPSSRSLTSAMVFGCIPFFVGSRLRGLCEPPCHPGFGWKPTGVEYPHLPFSETIDWASFPEIGEQEFMDDGVGVLHSAIANYGGERKENLRRTLQKVQYGFVYGWGNPVNSTFFGDAVNYTRRSFGHALRNTSLLRPRSTT